MENILARVYFALALLHEGEISNATALLRQAEEMQLKQQDMLSNAYCTGSFSYENGLAKYLLAMALEQQGDTSNARILYGKAEKINGCLPPIIELYPVDKNNAATLLCICHNGNVPFKISATCPASVASAAALEILLASQHINPACSSFTGIPVPALCQYPYSHPRQTSMQIAGVNTPLIPFYDVAAATYAELEYKKPLIVARGVARFLLRRSAVAYAQQQDPCVGAIVDFGLFLINSNTQVDTRSWDTLPSSIDLARYTLPPGIHHITLTVQRPGYYPYTTTLPIKVQTHDLVVINIFNIHPNLTVTLIPSRFNP